MMELIGYSHYSKNYNPLVKPGGKENVQYRYSNRFLPNVGFEYRFARTKKNRIVYFDYHRTAIAGVYAGGNNYYYIIQQYDCEKTKTISK